MNGPARSTASYAAELNQLRESLENAHRRLEVMQERLQALSRERGSQARLVEIFDVFGPAGSGSVRPAPRRARLPEAVWPSARPEGHMLHPTPGLANLTLTGRGLPAVGFSVCGFGREDLARIVELVANKQAADRNFIPVFLTDVMAADVFRRHRYVFEYFPGPDERRPPGTEPWVGYARRRLSLIKRKYALTQIISFGKRAFCAG